MIPDSQKQVMIEYLKLKLAQEDWHGCSDAANDLREMEAKAKAPKNIIVPFGYNVERVSDEKVIIKPKSSCV